MAWSRTSERAEAGDPQNAALIAVGAFAGLSSGFLGIGGGLATTVGLSAALGVPQRQAQMASLMLALIPTTAPAVWVYWREGAMASAPALIGVVLGLIAGTDFGARLANQINRIGAARDVDRFRRRDGGVYGLQGGGVTAYPLSLSKNLSCKRYGA